MYCSLFDLQMLIGFNGTKYDDISIAPAFLKAGNLTANDNSRITLNVNSEKGFIIMFNVKGYPGFIRWQQYRIGPDRKFTKLTNGSMVFNSTSLTGITTPTIDEGYAFVYA